MKSRVDFQIEAAILDGHLKSSEEYVIYKHYDHITFTEEMANIVQDAKHDVRCMVHAIRSWKRGFAIWPVRLEEGGWLWMQPMWVRRVDRSQPYCPISMTQYTRLRTQDYD